MVYLIAGLAVGLLVGLMAGFLAADWVQDNAKRQAGVLTARQQYELARAQVVNDDSCTMQVTRQERSNLLYRRAFPDAPLPYQPSVIVLAAPRAQGPQVVQPGTAVTRY